VVGEQVPSPLLVIPALHSVQDVGDEQVKQLAPQAVHEPLIGTNPLGQLDRQ